MKDNIIRTNECDYCGYRTTDAVKELRELPRQLRQATEIPSCFFRDMEQSSSSTFDCRHPSHEQASLEICRSCPDYKEQLRKKSTERWAVGITTAPREQRTLTRCIQSLTAAGWSPQELHLFAEPGSFVGGESLDSPITQRGKRVGAFPNWYLSLEELVLTQPNAEVYLLCQDDILVCRNLRGYLEQVLWPDTAVAFVSLYCGTLQPRPANHFGFVRIAKPDILYGALAIAFPAASARAMLLHPCVQRHRDGDTGTYGIDSILATWAYETGMPSFVHYPSLTGHIGLTSAIFRDAVDHPSRCTDSFIGEDQDPMLIVH